MKPTMEDMISRGWEELVERMGGPFTFRLVIQPAVAVFLAIRSGLRDAKERRTVFSGLSSWTQRNGITCYARGGKIWESCS